MSLPLAQQLRRGSARLRPFAPVLHLHRANQAVAHACTTQPRVSPHNVVNHSSLRSDHTGPRTLLVLSNTRFSKVLMDGGSSLNIMYSSTLELLGIGLDQLQPSTSPFHGVAPGKRVQPLGGSTYPSASARRTTSARRSSPLRWLDFGEHIMPSLGDRATPSSWRSRTTPTSR